MSQHELSLETYKRMYKFLRIGQPRCQKSAGGKPQERDSERLFLQWTHLLRVAEWETNNRRSLYAM